jgi:hypothetical protein
MRVERFGGDFPNTGPRDSGVVYMTHRMRLATIPVLTVAILALAATSCDNPVAALTGVTAVSTNPLSPVAPFDPLSGPAHTHRCTIPASDIADMLPQGGTYFTTTADGHAHQVVLNQADFEVLAARNGSVSVISSAAGDPPHRHRFVFTN